VLDLREIAKHGGTKRVPSGHLPWRYYKVNLGRLSCNCPEFKASRRMYLKGDSAAWCRHLATALLEHLGLPEGLRRMIMLERQLPLRYRFLADDTVLGSLPDSDWHYVYVRAAPATGSKAAYLRYCYNAAERRWISDQLPRRAQEVVALIDAAP